MEEINNTGHNQHQPPHMSQNMNQGLNPLSHSQMQMQSMHNQMGHVQNVPNQNVGPSSQNMGSHIVATNRRLLIMKNDLSNELTFKDTILELLRWCSDPRAFVPEYEQSLISCLTVVSQVALQPGFQLDLAYRLLMLCGKHRNKFSAKSASMIVYWTEELSRMYALNQSNGGLVNGNNGISEASHQPSPRHANFPNSIQHSEQPYQDSPANAFTGNLNVGLNNASLNGNFGPGSRQSVMNEQIPLLGSMNNDQNGKNASLQAQTSGSRPERRSVGSIGGPNGNQNENTMREISSLQDQSQNLISTGAKRSNSVYNGAMPNPDQYAQSKRYSDLGYTQYATPQTPRISGEFRVRQPMTPRDVQSRENLMQSREFQQYPQDFNGPNQYSMMQQNMMQQTLMLQNNTPRRIDSILQSSMNISNMRLAFPVRDGIVIPAFRLQHNISVSSHDFYLRDNVFPVLMMRNDLELQLKCFHHEDGNSVPNWPATVRVAINGVGVPIIRGYNSIISKEMPYINDHHPLDVKKLTKAHRNMLQISVRQCCCSHNFILQLVHRPNVGQVLQNIKTQSVYSVEDCVTRIKRLLNFLPSEMANITMTPKGERLVRISLDCAITSEQCEIPVRGEDCQHIQCFCVMAYIRQNILKNVWKCPICQKQTLLDKLTIDHYFVKLINSCPSNAITVLVNPEVNWSVVAVVRVADPDQASFPSQRKVNSDPGINTNRSFDPMNHNINATTPIVRQAYYNRGQQSVRMKPEAENGFRYPPNQNRMPPIHENFTQNNHLQAERYPNLVQNNPNNGPLLDQQITQMPLENPQGKSTQDILHSLSAMSESIPTSTSRNAAPNSFQANSNLRVNVNVENGRINTNNTSSQQFIVPSPLHQTLQPSPSTLVHASPHKSVTNVESKHIMKPQNDPSPQKPDIKPAYEELDVDFDPFEIIEQNSEAEDQYDDNFMSGAFDFMEEGFLGEISQPNPNNPPGFENESITDNNEPPEKSSTQISTTHLTNDQDDVLNFENNNANES